MREADKLLKLFTQCAGKDLDKMEMHIEKEEMDWIHRNRNKGEYGKGE